MLESYDAEQPPRFAVSDFDPIKRKTGDLLFAGAYPTKLRVNCSTPCSDYFVEYSDLAGFGTPGDSLTIAKCDGTEVAKELTVVASLNGSRICLPDDQGYAFA